MPAIRAFQREPGIIKVNKNTFYPIINFISGMTYRAFCFPWFRIDIAVNTERASNSSLINHFPCPDIPSALARVW